MVAVYQLIFFLALGLLAIAITVYVLAVSLLGRAVQMAITAQAIANEEQRKADEEEMGKIKKELSDAEKKNRSPDIERLSKAINSLKRKKWINNWKLKWINAKPKFLGSAWGAFIPGAFLLTSAIISIVAIYMGSGTPAISPYVWIAIATMGIGICFVCLSLKVIEGVARTSEEVAFKREVEIFETSLRKFEESKRPELELQFYKGSPPFHVKIDSDMTIDFQVSIKKGIYADDVNVLFFAPEGFGFPGKQETTQPQEHAIAPGYIATNVVFKESLLRTIDLRESIRIKAPSKADKYQLYYRVVCRGAERRHEKFEIVVEEKEVVGD